MHCLRGSLPMVMARRGSSSTELVHPEPEKQYLHDRSTIFAIFGWQ